MLSYVEYCRSPFEDVLDEGADRAVIKGSDAVYYRPSTLSVTSKSTISSASPRTETLALRVLVMICLVPLELTQLAHHAVVHEPVVEAVFGLIDDQRRSGCAKGQQRHSRPLPLGKIVHASDVTAGVTRPGGSPAGMPRIRSGLGVCHPRRGVLSQPVSEGFLCPPRDRLWRFADARTQWICSPARKYPLVRGVAGKVVRRVTMRVCDDRRILAGRAVWYPQALLSCDFAHLLT